MCTDKYHIDRTAPAAGKTLLGAAGSSAARTLCGMWFSVKNGDYIYDGEKHSFFFISCVADVYLSSRNWILSLWYIINLELS